MLKTLNKEPRDDRHWTRSIRAVLTIISGLILATTAAIASAADDDWSLAARRAYAAGKRDEAVQIVSRVIDAEPNNVGAWQLRGAIYGGIGQHEKAIADLSQALKLKDDLADAWQLRGTENFKLGKIDESIADFDRYLKLRPDKEPEHWQRGISYYYAGRFTDGRKQFELHQTVNPQDVENAVWHFLCTTRESNVDEARKHLIPITKDTRVPMAEVQALFAGRGTADDVLRAAQAGNPSPEQLREQLFYAHLYLGLYYEAIGDAAKAREHILAADEKYGSLHYMGDVARVHAARLRQTAPKS